MKIIRRGNLPAWNLRCTCTRCASVFLIEDASDMYRISHPTGASDGIYVDYAPDTFHCICPVCGKELRIGSGNIRDDIKQQVKLR